MKRIAIIMATLFTLATTTLSAQHTLGVMGGFGSGSERIYPTVEGKTIYGLINGGITWRTYSDHMNIGCFGVDLEFMQRGFSYSPYASLAEPGETLYYYTRKINTLMMPIVWQPYVYVFERRVRLFFEAMATFHYDLSSTYENDYLNHLYVDGYEFEWKGDYEYMTSRDNRLGYGLAGGLGIAYLVGKIEITARVRYYYDYSDVVRNRNKYYSNNNDGAENPFGLTPVRSPLSNLNFSFGINYHFGPEGFDAWDNKRIKLKKDKSSGFNYDGKI